MNVHLICIDPQRSFCCPDGELYVPGASEDMTRLAKMIDRIGPKINDIHVTLDSHHHIHIAHPVFWKDKKGKNPDPFTLINVDDVENGTWRATKPSLQQYALKYVKELKKNGRYVLCVWQPHCLIGTVGQTLHPEVNESLAKWSKQNFGYPDFITKGSNILTEHYSVVQADVPDPSDPSTQLNVGFINTLAEADMILFTGEAGSHCTKNSCEDIVNNFSDITQAKKIKLLKDTMSAVPGFEQQQQDLFNFCAKHDIEVLNSTEVLL